MEEDLKNILDDHEKRISYLESLFHENKEIPKKRLSIKEFLLEKNPEDDIQKTLFIGYYLEKFESLPSFNIKELEDGFRAAKETVPDNINYKVIMNVKKELMMEAKEKKDNLKAWNLTNSGEKYVEDRTREQ